MLTATDYQYLRGQSKLLRPLYDSLRKLRSGRKTPPLVKQAMEASANAILDNLEPITKKLGNLAKNCYPNVTRGQIVRITTAPQGVWSPAQIHGINPPIHLGKIIEFTYFEPSDYATEFYGDFMLHGYFIKKDGSRGQPSMIRLGHGNSYEFELV